MIISDRLYNKTQKIFLQQIFVNTNTKIMSSRKRYSYNGKTLTLREWSVETGINYNTLRGRINANNWDIKDALEIPRKRYHPFEGSKIKREMLRLKRSGATVSELATKYKVHHTTILYHCKKAGLSISEIGRNAINRLLNENKTINFIADFLGFDRTVVRYYCMQNSICPKLDKSGFPSPNPKVARSNISEHRIDDRGVEWKSDNRGGWICLGGSDQKQQLYKEEYRKKMLEAKRLKMLEY